MAATSSSEQIRTFASGIGLRQVRLVSGSILFAYLVSHFPQSRAWQYFAGGDGGRSALAHRILAIPSGLDRVLRRRHRAHVAGLWALYERRQFRWKTMELLQLTLGLSVPVLIIAHVLGVRLAYTLQGHEILYPQVLFAYFVSFPAWRLWGMIAVILASWIHGCIGLNMWLRMKPFYARAAPLLFAAAVLLPALAMLGVYQGGRSVVDNDSVEWRTENLSVDKIGTNAQHDIIDHVHRILADSLSRLDRIGAAGKRRARPARASRRHDQLVLRQWPLGARAQGAHRAGSEPAQQRAACLGLRRPRPLLDLSHPHHRRLQPFAGAVAARGLRAAPGRHRRSLDPPCLPAQA
jgi:hypothetical protein